MDGSLGYIISALILLEIARSQMKPFISSQREERRHHHSDLAVIYYREFVSFQCHRLMGNPLWAPELSSLLHASPTLGPWQCLWLWRELNFTVQYRWGWGACKQTRIANCPFCCLPNPHYPLVVKWKSTGTCGGHFTLNGEHLVSPHHWGIIAQLEKV